MFLFIYFTVQLLDSYFTKWWDLISDAYLTYVKIYFNDNELLAFVITMYCLHHGIVSFYTFINYLFHRYHVFYQYKIRKEDDNDYHLINIAFFDLIKRLFTSLPLWGVVYYILKFSGCAFLEPLPTKETTLFHLLLLIMITDFSYYWMHRWMHEVPWMYRIHKIHHEFKATSAVGTLYAHPLETLFVTFGTVILGAILIAPHSFIFGLYYCLQLIEALEVHSGFIFPFSMINQNSFLFFSASRHDFHHSHNIGCYGRWTRFMDSWYQTDAEFEKWKQEQTHTIFPNSDLKQVFDLPLGPIRRGVQK